jgi:asparagine synthase (glutamine-hydrolysing)
VSALALAHSARDGEVAVGRMLDAVPHRGSQRVIAPSGATVLGVVSRADEVGAGVARQGRSVAAFAGTLDDQDALAAQLGTTPGDPAAMVLAAWSRWGEDALPRLRGTFACAVSDGETVRCFRDRFGSTPLFWGSWSGALYAATEPKQVVAGAGVAREPDVDGLEQILFGGVGDTTAVRGVRRIPRASIATGRDGAMTVRRYWDPASLIETRQVDVEEAAAELCAVLERAVVRRLSGADAVLLSGGMDSPTIAALAARAAPAGSVWAVSAVYPNHPSVDERPYIETVTGALGIPLHTYVPQAGPLDDVQTWVDLLDGPIDVLSIPQVAEAYRVAAATGARTVLCGEIEEYALEVRAFLLDHLLGHRRWRAFAGEIASRRRNGRTNGAILRALVWPLLPPWIASTAARHRADRRMIPEWIDPARVGGGTRRDDLRRRRRDRWRALQTSPLFGRTITIEADEMCAAHCGVTPARPFADVELWEFALSLPAEVKFPEARPKELLRRAARGLVPDAILDRRDKTVFNEYGTAHADYPALRKWILTTEHRIGGVDYALLAERLDREDLDVVGMRWAHDLARVHAFLALW